MRFQKNVINKWDNKFNKLSKLDQLILRSNLLGGDLKVTNFGGGNTSSKISVKDPITKKNEKILYVKGSGGDLGSIRKDGFASLYLDKFNSLKNIYRGFNVDAVFRMCRSAIPPMKKQGEGVILNIGSISGLVSNIPQPQTAYNASKAAVHMMTKSLASDYANQNIRVNAIAPGYVRTEMTNLPKENEHWYPTWNELTPMNRMAEPDEIASAALFLCSPASSYVTGEVLVVDGGYTSR